MLRNGLLQLQISKGTSPKLECGRFVSGLPMTLTSPVFYVGQTPRNSVRVNSRDRLGGCGSLRHVAWCWPTYAGCHLVFC